MSLRPANSSDDSVDWIHHAVFEAAGLRKRLEFERDDPARSSACPRPTQQGVPALYRSTPYSTYPFRREDSPCMDPAARRGDDTPFHTLLKQINETHRLGLEVDEDDA